MENGLERGGVDGPREKTLSLLVIESMVAIAERNEEEGAPGEV